MKFFKKIFAPEKFISRAKICLLFILLVGMKPAADEGNEYSVKAMFIYNFTKYIDWPQSTNNKTFRIGIIGKSEIFETLQLVASQKKVDNRQIEIKKITEDDNSYYQLIFIAKSETQNINELSKKYFGKGVLIVSEECKRSERGATINLLTTDNKVRFEISQGCARNAGLKVSSILINLAVAVNP